MVNRRDLLKSTLAASALTMLSAGEASAQMFETRAGQAFMVDAETGTILFSKDADKLVPPASLAKLMTMEVVFHNLKTGQNTLEDTFHVSENAWRTGGTSSGGSTMFAKLNSQIRLEDLIQGVVIQSANDGCIVIAEGMAGSEQNFAALMNERARAIGLQKSVFKNSTGLPAEGQLVTMRELAQLAMHIWREYPDRYGYYSQRDFTWNKIKQRNRNPLLAMDIGADGMKTGFTEESGYAIVGSVNRDGKRLFAAMSGMASDKERAVESRKLLEWGMRAFRKLPVFAEGETVGEASVYGGNKSTVALKAGGPVSLFVPVANRDRLVARIEYQGPIRAPVETGAPIGKLKVWLGDTLSQETPLFAAENIGTGTLQQRAMDAASELMVGWTRRLN